MFPRSGQGHHVLSTLDLDEQSRELGVDRSTILAASQFAIAAQLSRYNDRAEEARLEQRALVKRLLGMVERAFPAAPQSGRVEVTPKGRAAVLGARRRAR